MERKEPFKPKFLITNTLKYMYKTKSRSVGPELENATNLFYDSKGM